VDANFWHRRERNEPAFHQREANPLLVKYFDTLSLSKRGRVFLPLCGKTLDIHWLLSNGYRVAGSELSIVAVKQLFSELAIEPKIIAIDDIHHHSADNIDIFVGTSLICRAVCSVGWTRFMTGLPWWLFPIPCGVDTRPT
jgi:thiopurine S-methyltransferase